MRWYGPAAAAMLLVTPAAADAPDPPPIEAAILASPCASCHGTEGASPGAIPPLRDLAPARIGALMRDYRAGILEGTVMNRIARGYTEAEIDLLVVYFAGVSD